MSTEENKTEESAPNDASTSNQTTTEHASEERAPEAPAQAASDAAAPHDDDGDSAGNVAPAASANASEATDEAWEEPGDDVGNRVGAAGEVGGNIAPVEYKPGDPRAPKKKRRRRKKKPQDGQAVALNADGTPVEQVEGEESEGEEGDETAEGAEGEAGEGGQKKKRKGPRPERDRPAFTVGEEVFGKVAGVTTDAVWINISDKAMGLFDRRELGEGEAPSEGDQFIATVASAGVRGGMLKLSRQSVKLDEVKAKMEAAAASGELVEGYVMSTVKGGLEVDLEGLRAFAPASHVDLHHGADLSPMVGERYQFHVAQYAKKGRDVVVSRKKMLEEERGKIKHEALAKLEQGSVHKGIVRKIVQWGVFVALPDADNVEGLVHMTEASHDRGARLNDLFKPGQEIEVKVMRVDERGKLWLSHRATVADPWDAVREKYKVGTTHKGKVARLQPFGAFIELEPGIDGLIHTGDLSMKPIEHPQEVVKVGDEIDVIVASCDPNMHRIGLHPAPPESEANEPRQKIAPHKAVKVAVVQTTEGGLIVRILGVTGRSARGFIPGGHTGTPRGTDLRKTFPIGTQFEAKIIEIDPRRGEAKLSIRALKEDTEKHAYQTYRATVARESKFGTFGDLLKQKLGQG